jgi:hypothetical protein
MSSWVLGQNLIPNGDFNDTPVPKYDCQRVQDSIAVNYSGMALGKTKTSEILFPQFKYDWSFVGLTNPYGGFYPNLYHSYLWRDSFICNYFRARFSASDTFAGLTYSTRNTNNGLLNLYSLEYRNTYLINRFIYDTLTSAQSPCVGNKLIKQIMPGKKYIISMAYTYSDYTHHRLRGFLERGANLYDSSKFKLEFNKAGMPANWVFPYHIIASKTAPNNVRTDKVTINRHLYTYPFGVNEYSGTIIIIIIKSCPPSSTWKVIHGGQEIILK